MRRGRPRGGGGGGSGARGARSQRLPRRHDSRWKNASGVTIGETKSDIRHSVWCSGKTKTGRRATFRKRVVGGSGGPVVKARDFALSAGDLAHFS